MKKYCKANLILSFINLAIMFFKEFLYQDPCSYEGLRNITNYTPFDNNIAEIIIQYFDKVYSLISFFLIINMIIIIIVNIIFSIKKVKHDFYSISATTVVWIILNLLSGSFINLMINGAIC